MSRAAGLRRLAQEACCVGVVYCGGRLFEMCVIFGESSVRACVNVVYSGEMSCVCAPCHRKTATRPCADWYNSPLLFVAIVRIYIDYRYSLAAGYSRCGFVCRLGVEARRTSIAPTCSFTFLRTPQYLFPWRLRVDAGAATLRDSRPPTCCRAPRTAGHRSMQTHQGTQ